MNERAARLLASWWILLGLVPLGLTAWVAPLYAGARARKPGWVVAGVVFGLTTTAGFLLIDGDEVQGTREDVGVVVLLIGWIGPILHSLAIRRRYLELTRGSRRRENAELRDAEANAAARAEARRLAREDPIRALELRVGRPDLPNSFDAGLVDLNNAPAKALERAPGIDRRLARRIVAVREEINGFDSLEDMGHVLGLDADTIDRMRLHVVVLPRGVET